MSHYQLPTIYLLTLTTMIESIEQLTDETVLFICSTEDDAKTMLKRNARASIQQSEDGRYGLVYRMDECNLANAIIKKRR